MYISWDKHEQGRRYISLLRSYTVTPAGASLTMYREIRPYANSIWDDNNNNNNIVAIYSRVVAVPFSTSVCVLRTKHKTPIAGGISYLFCRHEQVDGIFLSCVYTRREDVSGRVIAAPFTWTSVSACALSDRRYIALLCSYTFSVLLLHRCVLFVFPLSLYHSQRTSTPRVCMSISVGNRIDGIFLFCIETHRSVLFVVTPSSCCPYNVQSERLLQVSACAFLGRASTRMPKVHSSKFCFHIVAVCLWSRRPCHVHRERLPHMSVCVCTSWAKLDENADDIYLCSVFIHIVAYYRSVLFVVALSR